MMRDMGLDGEVMGLICWRGLFERGEDMIDGVCFAVSSIKGLGRTCGSNNELFRPIERESPFPRPVPLPSTGEARGEAGPGPYIKDPASILNLRKINTPIP